MKTSRALWLQRGVLAAMVIIIGYFGSRALQRGAFADRCVDELVKRSIARDKPFLEGAVQSPLVVEQLLAAKRVELVFVRPLSEDWTRVGIAARATETATRADLLQLVLDNRVERCTFLRDYEAGAFGTE